MIILYHREKFIYYRNKHAVKYTTDSKQLITLKTLENFLI